MTDQSSTTCELPSSSSDTSSVPMDVPDDTVESPDEVVTGGRTVACRLDATVRWFGAAQPALGALREWAVVLHRLRRDAHELISHHVLRVLEAGEVVPDLSKQSTVYRFFVAVTDSEGKSSYPELDNAISETRNACMPTLQRHAWRLGMSESISSESKRYKASVGTQVHRSFRSRVGRIVKLRLRLSDEELATMTADEKKRYRYHTKIAMTAATRPSCSNGLPPTHAAVVDAVVADLGIAKIDLTVNGKATSMAYVLKVAPCRFLPALHRINLELEANKERRFRLVPMTTSNVPGFFTIDQGLIKMLGLLTDEQKREIDKRIRDCNDTKRPCKDELKRLRAELRELEAPWKETDAKLKTERSKSFKPDWEAKETLDAIVRELELRAADAAAAVGAKRKRVSKKARPLKRRKMPANPVLTSEQKEIDAATEAVRGALRKPIQDAINAILKDPTYVQLCDDRVNERRAAFEAVFDISKAVRHPEQWTLSISTDGFSARLLLDRPQSCPSGSSDDTKKLTAMPKRGIFTVDKLAGVLTNGRKLKDGEAARLRGLPPQELNCELQRVFDEAHDGVCPFVTVGVDPGKAELVVATDPNAAPWNKADRLNNPLPATAKERKQRPGTEAAVRYTSKQRRFDIAPGKFVLNKRGRKDPAMVARAADAQVYRRSIRPADQAQHDAAVAALSLHCSAAATSEGFRAYTDARRAAQFVFDAVYADTMLHRRLRWKAFIDKQKSIQELVNRFKTIEKAQGKQVVLAYGAWGMQAGVAGLPVNKGLPPCIGVGLLRHLARFFVVIVVPEHFTSKTCFHCGCHECGNHPKIAEQHRPGRDARALQKRDKNLERIEATGGDEKDIAKTHLVYTKTIARVPEIRGLRFCPKCTRCLNRDRNAANNIGLQLKRLAFRLGPIRAMDADERVLHSASNELEGSDDA